MNLRRLMFMFVCLPFCCKGSDIDKFDQSFLVVAAINIYAIEHSYQDECIRSDFQNELLRQGEHEKLKLFRDLFSAKNNSSKVCLCAISSMSLMTLAFLQEDAMRHNIFKKTAYAYSVIAAGLQLHNRMNLHAAQIATTLIPRRFGSQLHISHEESIESDV